MVLHVLLHYFSRRQRWGTALDFFARWAAGLGAKEREWVLRLGTAATGVCGMQVFYAHAHVCPLGQVWSVSVIRRGFKVQQSLQEGHRQCAAVVDYRTYPFTHPILSPNVPRLSSVYPTAALYVAAVQRECGLYEEALGTLQQVGTGRARGLRCWLTCGTGVGWQPGWI